MMRKMSLIILVALYSFAVMAQKVNVTGTVTDENGKALIGAIVTVKSSKAKTITNESGLFTVSAEKGDVIVVNYVGYETGSHRYDGSGSLSIKLVIAEKNLDEVVVLGSRGIPRTKLESTVPVDVFDMKTLVSEIPQTDLTGILNYIAPSFNSTTQTVADGTDHVDPATVRGLGADQTLVLINGKRRYTSALVNLNGTMGRGSVGTDLNAIPAGSIDKIELLRDGAAAQYGSDAVAGVLNIQLNNSVNKGKASISYGSNITTYQAYTHANAGNFVSSIDPVYVKKSVTDGQKLQATINYGWQLGKQKGSFINFTGNFEKREPTIRSGERAGDIDNRKSGDVASKFLLDSLGVTRDFFQMRVGQSRTQNVQGVINGALKLKNESEFYFFSIVSQRIGNSTGFYRIPFQSSNIPAIYSKGFLPEIGSNITDLSLAAGLKGKWGEWNYDLSNAFGQNAFKYTVQNSLNVSAWYNNSLKQTSFDAGVLQFQQNTTNFDLSRNYHNALKTNLAFGAEFRYENYQQKAGEEASWANYMRRTGGNVDIVNGTPTSVKLADGSTGIPAGGSQVFPGFRPDNSINKSRTSYALYGDVELEPVKGVLVDGALRYENYNDFGGNLSGKLAARYKVDQHMSIRGAISTGFRAPSLQQKYLTKTSTVFQGGIAYDDATLPNDSRAAQLLGIPSLRPEISRSVSLGVTMKYGKFTFTVDGFSTKVTDRIILTDAFTGKNGGTSQEQQIYDILLANNASRGVFMANAIDLRTSGIDAITTYSVRLPKNQSLKFELAATFSKREILGDAKSSAVLKGREHIYMSPVNRATLIEGNPQVKGNLTLSYKMDKLFVMMRNTYFGKVIHLEGASVASALGSQWFYKQEIGAKVVTDISVGYNVNKTMRVSAGANNLFDGYSDLLNASKGKYIKLDVVPSSATYNTIIDTKSAKDAGVTNNNGVASNNQFNYSRRVTQIGMNGRYVFLKFEVTL
ncbi:MAG: TonB-dependent receptor [Sediminibacterium sp.]|nr:TonB-dependent receptor [Sediminibacterium sp.]